MEKLDKIFDKAMAAGKELAELKEAKSREMQEATDAVTAAAAEMEKAAIDGNEAAYAKAKEKKYAAENRLEIMQIRARNKITTTDWIKEAAPILDELRKNSVAEIRKMIQDFCSKDAELLKVIESISEYSQKYNQVLEYFRSYQTSSRLHSKDNQRSRLRGYHSNSQCQLLWGPTSTNAFLYGWPSWRWGWFSWRSA